MDQFRRSLDRRHTAMPTFSGKTTSYRVLDYRTIHLIQRVLFCSTNSLLHLSIWLCPIPHPSPPSMSTWKTGNSLQTFSSPLTSQKPHSAVLIKHSSSLFVSQRSLLPVLLLAGTRWWMYGAFVSEVFFFFPLFLFFFFIVSLHYSSSHHHHTVQREWPETKWLSFFLEIIKSAVPGLTVGISEAIKVTLS